MPLPNFFFRWSLRNNIPAGKYKSFSDPSAPWHTHPGNPRYQATVTGELQGPVDCLMGAYFVNHPVLFVCVSVQNPPSGLCRIPKSNPMHAYWPGQDQKFCILVKLSEPVKYPESIVPGLRNSIEWLLMTLGDLKAYLIRSFFGFVVSAYKL